VEAAAAADRYLRERPAAPVRSFAELVASRAFTRWAAVGLERARAFDAESAAGRAAAAAAAAARRELQARTDRLFQREGLAAVAYPSVQRPAFPLGVEQSGVFSRWSENTGRPSVGVPMGLVEPSDGGYRLPCSLELLGAERGDRALLGVAGAVEAAIAPLTGAAGR
ncbi:MAG: hypothetical protein LBD90_08765, partial [Bifidobacteriaceae bacterium]|nr:hypothetical protein [Bifidobacteriaceae bacterium]